MNKTNYKQYDTRWAKLPYPKKPYYIKDCGCGEVAICNAIIEMDKYKNETPKTIQPYAKQFAASNGNGTEWAAIPKMMKHFGMTEVTEHYNMASLWKELAKGNRVAIYLMDNDLGGSRKIKWTGSKHFVTSVDYKYENGKHKVYMKDSNSASENRNEWISYEECFRNSVYTVWSGKLSGAPAPTPTPTPTPKPKKGIYTGKYPAPKKYLEKGDKGTEVTKLQQYLNWSFGGQAGFTKLKEDGIYGNDTYKWTCLWQNEAMGKGQGNGEVGPKTIAKMKEYGSYNPTPTPPSPTPKPDKTDYKVIDISFVQKNVDFNKVKAAGIGGVMIRCGFRGYETAKLQEDAQYQTHIKNAHKAGLPVGVYFFTEAINAKEGKEEADYAIKLVEKMGIPISYPIAVDTEAQSAKTERAKNLSKAKRTEAIKGFCDECIAKGYKPMIYASTSWLNNKLDMSKLPYDVWCAQYYDKCEYKGKYVMWQYTSTGKVNGISGVVDMNHCYIQPTPNPPKPEPTPKPKKTVEELAWEVLLDKWGSGDARKKALEDAGYDYYAVQARVTELVPIVDKIAHEVIDDPEKWGKGDVRKERLEKAGYNYYVIQKKVNEILERSIVQRCLDACIVQADWMKNYTYKWENNPTIEKSKKYGTCVTYVACVLQRIGILKSGQFIWIDNKGKVDGANSKMTVTYMSGTLKSNKSKLKKGDIVIGGDGSTGAGQGSHIFILTGAWKGDDPYIYDQNSAGRVKQGKSPHHTWKGSFKTIALIRLKSESPQPEPEPTPEPEPDPQPEKKGYEGKLPTFPTKVSVSKASILASKANEFAYADSPKKAKYPSGQPKAAYKAGLNKAYPDRSGWGKAPKAGASCDVFVGTCVRCAGVDSKYPRGLSQSYTEKCGHFTKVSKSDVRNGDVIFLANHVCIAYGGKVKEASLGDFYPETSNALKKRVNSAEVIYRAKGTATIERNYIQRGDSGEAITELQNYLNWYTDGKFFKECGGADGIFGPNTEKYTKAMQTDFFGASEADGLVGPKTVAKMADARK